MDRNVLNDAINSGSIMLPNGSPVQTPKSILCTPADLVEWKKDPSRMTLKFPVICKPVQACGTRDSHQMMILTGPNAIQLIESDPDQSWVFQEYLNHNSTIYKVYVIGEYFEVTPRLSLPNFPKNYPLQDCIHFNSHDPVLSSIFEPAVRPESSATSPAAETAAKVSPRVPPFFETQDEKTPTGADASRTRSPLVRGSRSQHMELWNSLSTHLRESLKLDLFGYDVIVEESTGLYYIVDVNYFPSYKNITQFPELLLAYLLTRLSGTRHLFLDKSLKTLR
jgi:inositol-1,3,4-trisphosphate 5/6-kinase/inositol-tetrakisphosphate 1-kinase